MKASLEIALLVAFCIFMIHSGIGHTEETKEVATIISSFYKDNGLAGISVSIRKGENTVTYKHGYANLESSDAISDESVFRIGSVSKLFTMLGILKLKEQGKLSIEDPLSKYVPGFPYGDRLTVKNLLQHTSGIPNFSVMEPFSANEAKEWTPSELVWLLKQHLEGHPLDFDPGTKADYSNSNYMLLGVIIEAASGMAFKAFVAQEVVKPLGMKNSAVGSDTEIIPHRAAGYVVQDGKIVNAQFVSVVAPFATGDFMSQPRELVMISKAFTPGALLNASTIQEMSVPVVLKDGNAWTGHAENFDYSFGYCWELIKPNGCDEWVYTKGGAINGFFAYVLYFKSADLTVAISTNSQGNFSLLELGMKIGKVMGASR